MFNVTAIHPDKISEAELLELAAYAESYSDHPISRSIREAYGQDIDQDRVGAVEELAGRGVRAVIDGKTVCVGNSKLMDELGAKWHPCTTWARRYTWRWTGSMPGIWSSPTK